MARVLVVLGGELAGALADGSMPASARTRPSAFETTLWATTSTSCGPSGGSSRAPAAASSAARSSPGRTSGRPGSAGAGALRRRGRAARAARACAARAAAAGVERGAQRREVAGRVDVELERGQAADAHRRARSVGERRVAGEEPGPKAGVSAVGGSISSAFVPEPWRSGHDHDARPGGGEQLVDLAGSSAGQSPGTSSTRSRAARDRGPTPRAAAADWPASTGSWTHLRTPRALRCPRVLRGDDDHAVEAVDRAERVEHVADHRRGELAPVRRADRLAEALLGSAERLDGEDGDGAHRARDITRAARRRTPGSRAPRAGGRRRRPSRRRSRASGRRSPARR